MIWSMHKNECMLGDDSLSWVNCKSLWGLYSVGDGDDDMDDDDEFQGLMQVSFEFCTIIMNLTQLFFNFESFDDV